MILEKLQKLSDSEIITLSKEVDGQWTEESEVFNNDEDGLKSLFYEDMDEAVRSTCYGDYEYTHKFIRLDGHSNLESTNDLSDFIDLDELAEHIEDNLEKFPQFQS